MKKKHQKVVQRQVNRTITSILKELSSGLQVKAQLAQHSEKSEMDDYLRFFHRGRRDAFAQQAESIDRFLQEGG